MLQHYRIGTFSKTILQQYDVAPSASNITATELKPRHSPSNHTSATAKDIATRTAATKEDGSYRKMRQHLECTGGGGRLRLTFKESLQQKAAPHFRKSTARLRPQTKHLHAITTIERLNVFWSRGEGLLNSKRLGQGVN
jgi:hypothetical protein